MNLGPTELLFLGLLVILLFGAKKVPEFFASLGKGIKEFKKAVQSDDEPESRPHPPDAKPPDGG